MKHLTQMEATLLRVKQIRQRSEYFKLRNYLMANGKIFRVGNFFITARSKKKAVEKAVNSLLEMKPEKAKEYLKDVVNVNYLFGVVNGEVVAHSHLRRYLDEYFSLLHEENPKDYLTTEPNVTVTGRKYNKTILDPEKFINLTIIM